MNVMNKTKVFSKFLFLLTLIESFYSFSNNNVIKYNYSDCKETNTAAELYNRSLDVGEFDSFNEGFYSTHFFNRQRKIYNTLYGSCTYVALASLLTYYDLYWNDNIVSSTFELSNVTLPSNNICVNDVPTYRLNYFYSTMPQNDYINLYKNTYLVSKLLDIGYNHFGYYNSLGDSIQYGLTFSETIDVINYYLTSVCNFSQSDYEIVIYTSEAQVENDVSKGIPVMTFSINNSMVGHTMVAYDIDSYNRLYVDTFIRKTYYDGNEYRHTTRLFDDGNEYYTHHVPLGVTDFPIFLKGISISFKTEHIHSNRFLYIDNESNNIFHCLCESPTHDNYSGKPNCHFENFYINISPSIIIDDLCTAYIYGYNIVIANLSCTTIYIDQTIQNNSILINNSVWQSMLNDGYNSFMIQIGRITKENKKNLMHYSNAMSIEYPILKKGQFLINQELLCFSSAYQTGQKSITLPNNVHAQINYCRVGFIENEVITLSARKIGYGIAYIEFFFDSYIKSTEFRVALWSDREYLYDNGSIAKIQIKSGNSNWTEMFDLLYDYNMSIKTVQYDCIMSNISEAWNIDAIRIYIQTNPVGTWNRGRICLEDFRVEFYE